MSKSASLAGLVLVDGERVADVGAGIDVIDVEDGDLVVAGLDQLLEELLGDLVARLGIDLARLGVDHVVGEVVAVEVLVGDLERLDALLGKLTGAARGELVAGLDHHLAGVGVDQVGHWP